MFPSPLGSQALKDVIVAGLLALAVADPPPETLTWLVTDAGAFAATLTLTVIIEPKRGKSWQQTLRFCPRDLQDRQDSGRAEAARRRHRHTAPHSDDVSRSWQYLQVQAAGVSAARRG